MDLIPRLVDLLPCQLRTLSMVKKLNIKKVAFYSIIFITFLISAIAYHTYFENGWYVQDDYMTMEPGGAGSIDHTAGKIISWLNSAQGRFQPVRLFLFSAATHIFQEEYTPIYNFILHLANLLLLFFLLRKFSTSNVDSLIIILWFSLFGRWRMMESPSAMIGGSGLNLLFILITLIFLIKAGEESNWSAKKIIWFAISLTAYVGLTFSYEVAFPLFLVVIYTFIVFHIKNNGSDNQWDIKRYLPLMAYLAPLFIFLIFFRHTASSYEGARITWSYDILMRFIAYSVYTLIYPIRLGVRPEVILLFFLYFFAIFIAISADKVATANKRFDSQPSNYKLFGFGVIFYFSSVVLFILNSWLSPRDVMAHHTYLITAGSSIIIVSSILGLRHFVFGQAKKIYYRSMIFVFVPLILAAGLYNTVEYYEKQQRRTDAIKSLKYKIQSTIKDPTKIDAILIKNFTHNYYGISGMDGAFLQWFNYKKYIHSGREIISVLDNKIKFKGPLTYYRPATDVHEVDNEKIEMFYLNTADGKLLAYSDAINFQKEQNLHQIDQVMGDADARQCDKDYVLDAALKNLSGKDTLAISLGSERDIGGFLKGARIEINGRVVKSVLTTDKDIYINGVAGTKYLFLKITSIDDRFKSHLNEIKIVSIPSDIKSTRVQLDDAPPEFSQSSFPQPLTLEWGNGFYGVEGDATHNWRWASPTGDLFITNTTQQPLKTTVAMTLGTGHNERHTLVIKSQLWNDQVSISSKALQYKKTLTIPPGKHLVRFESNSPAIASPDPRILSFVMEDFKGGVCGSPVN